MTTHILKILIVISKSRINKKGLVPVICRITYLGKRKPFSTGLFINPDYWNSKKQKAIPSNKENDFINTQISLIKQEINQAFLFLQVNNDKFDVEDIFLQYKGENIKVNKTFLEVFDMHNSRIQKLLGIEYTKSTYSKFVECRNLMARYIKFQYKRNDITFNKLNLKFLQDLDYYLKVERGQQQSTINKHIQRVRKITKIAVAEEYLDKDPFILYKQKRQEKKVVYLTQDELHRLETHKISQCRLAQVRDMFVFCCYTGLAYAEMNSLSKKHIIKGFDGNKWIQMYRQKTGSKVSIPLLPKALTIATGLIESTDSDKVVSSP